jgi:CRP-like cAMP-binding protein
MFNTQSIFDVLIARFESRVSLTSEEREAIRSMPFELRTYPIHSYLVREGDRATSAKLLIDGLAYRHKVTVEGARQILSVHIAGDFVDLEGSLVPIADHNVQVLSTCTVAQVPRDALVAIIHKHGAVAHAMWIETLVDASIYREWVVNVGRRDSRQAMCHFLCEFGRRLESAGLAKAHGYELPMTQEQLADTLGITPVHVNRVLRDLDHEGVLVRHKRFVEVPDWERLRKLAGFNDLYLHLDLLAA